jgi:hypothetical protein
MMLYRHWKYWTKAFAVRDVLVLNASSYSVNKEQIRKICDLVISIDRPQELNMVHRAFAAPPPPFRMPFRVAGGCRP